MSRAPSNIIAACFALAAFAVAVVAGMAGGNPATAILIRALIAMIGCYPVGLIIGLICARVMTDHIQAHRDAVSAAESSRANQIAPSQANATTEAQSE